MSTSSEREGRVGSSGSSRRDGKRSVCLFPRGTILNIQHFYDAARGMMTSTTTSGRDGGVRRVFCLRVFFCRVYVQLRAVERGRLMQMHDTQCASIASTYLCYMLSGSVFSTATVYFCASYTGNTRGSLFRERVGKGRTEERGSERKTAAGQASSIDRGRRSLRITSPPRHPTRVARGNKRSYIL